MAMEEVQVLQHLGHDHPLMLIKPEETDDSWDLSCYGCEQPILVSSWSSSYYGCKRCVFFLHKTCAQLPHKMTHPYHPQHPLTLLPSPPSWSHKCDVCREYCNRFTYRCYDCDYDIDMKCALPVLSIQQSIKHTSHPHQLIIQQMESIFLCYACGIKHEGTSFLCTTCGFWINQECASSPINLKLNNHHHHTLSLIYFIPQEVYQHRHPSCEICSKRIYRRFWVYCCSECRYLVHLRCAVSDKRNNETENQSHDRGLNPISLSSSNLATATSDADLHKVIYLPVPDDTADIITQFIKNTAIQGKHEGAAEIKHGSHDHQLTLSEEPIDHALSQFNVAWNVHKCCGCAQSFSAPFYCCLECEFYLHVWCAELPEELRHPGHPQHPLFLSKEARTGQCECCNLFGSTLSYGCEECDFYLDCKCASLPRVIKHESHDKHTLALRSTSFSSTTCKSCSASLTISFQCWGCKFNLCLRCTILPRTVRHRYDKHPFTLTYSPRPYRTDDDFCEICEEGIDSNRWFYHCGECDQYLHTDCILPVDQFSNMVYNRKSINSSKHPHRLIHVADDPYTWCHLCETSNADSGHYLCPPCGFYLCDSCEEKEIEGEI